MISQMQNVVNMEKFDGTEINFRHVRALEEEKS